MAPSAAALRLAFVSLPSIPLAATATPTDNAGVIAGVALLFLALAIYFLPWIIANFRRHHNQVALFFLNLLLGWTLVGWAVALVWAFAKPPTVVVANTPASPTEERYPCPVCAEGIIPGARVCRFCGHQLPAEWWRSHRGRTSRQAAK